MSINQQLFEPFPGPPQPVKNPSPVRILTILAVSIFMAEIIAMAILYFLPGLGYLVRTLLDGLIMIALIIPMLYLLQLKPIRQQIEDRNKAEAALRSGEELLKKVLELIPVGVWITDHKGDIVHGNPASKFIWAGARYVGIQQYGEYRAWWADSGKRVEPHEWAVVRAIQHRETSLNEELEIETFDGSRKVILNSAVPILGEQDSILGAIIVNQDVTQQRQEQKLLIETNELMERFFLSIHTLIAYMDRDFNFIRVNDTYARYGGHHPEYYPGRNHFQLYPNEENQAIFQKVVETGEPYYVYEKPFEYQEFPERGVTYWDWSLQPVKGAVGEIEGVVLSLVDITERKKAEMELERQNQELELLSNVERKQRELAEALTQAAKALNSSLEVHIVLDQILEQIHKVIPCDAATVVIRDGDKPLSVRYYNPEDAASLRQFKLNQSEIYPIFKILETGREPLTSTNQAGSSNSLSISDLNWARSYAIIPILVRDNLTGFIGLFSARPEYFDQKSVDILLTFATHAVVAIQNARLYEDEQQSRQTAETLRSATLTLSRSLELDSVIKSLFDYIDQMAPFDRASFILLAANDCIESVVIRENDGTSAVDQKVPETLLDMDNPLIQIVSRSRAAVVISDQDELSEWKFWLGDQRYKTCMLVPLISVGKLSGFVGLEKSEPNFYSQHHSQLVEALVSQASAVIQNARLFNQIRAAHTRLQNLSHRLVELQEAERHYIARELHDEAGQSLASIMLGLNMLERGAYDPEVVKRSVADMENRVDNLMENLHRLAMNLRPPALDHLGLASAVRNLLDEYGRQHQLDIRFICSGLTERLPAEVETAFYRIVQEAVTNIIRHAQAKQVVVELNKTHNLLILVVKDDGVGFDPKGKVDKGRLGLVGIQERTDMLGGALFVESKRDKGTALRIEVPWS
jgi:PAS domain S-box-containing protein